MGAKHQRGGNSTAAQTAPSPPVHLVPSPEVPPLAFPLPSPPPPPPLPQRSIAPSIPRSPRPVRCLPPRFRAVGRPIRPGPVRWVWARSQLRFAGRIGGRIVRWAGIFYWIVWYCAEITAVSLL